MDTVEGAEAQLWEEYRQGQLSARDRLVTRYLPLAKKIAAAQFARRRVDSVEFGDYLQLAHLGLLEALQRFRADAEAQFATFATYRIRGAIINGVAKMTETGERIGYLRRAARDRAGSIAHVQQKPDTLATLMELVMAVAITCQLDEIAEQEAAEPTPASDPYSSRAYHDTQQRIRQALNLLPERERQIVEWHYFQQLGFDEIASALNVSKGRISQLHSRALELIRTSLAKSRLAEFF